jgi:hypothetical protein
MKNWEKEFNEEFCFKYGKDYIFNLLKVSPEKVKFFINQTLFSQLQELRDEIAGEFTKEIRIAQKDGQPTSKLTLLFIEINYLIDKRL